ncbi:GDSL-type esterase/lipase family protein [Arcanobacterium bovis]|uniref:GDSL-type esterase/lipase family protein n=1 Tax=Arcanobacterium bovis TaxID=2529275 RepID=UPI0013F1485F|nr:GDSL-type esterase/lipase family protein [Arcanobacterium bovis]
MKKRRNFLAIIAAFSLFAVATSPLTAQGDDSPTNPQKLNFVQLGDSYSSGNGANSYYELNCHRSLENYGNKTASTLAASYRNVACGNAVGANLIDTPQHLGKISFVTRGYNIPTSAYPDQAAEWLNRVKAENLCGPVPLDNGFWEYRMVAPAPAGNLFTATLECHLYNDVQIKAVTPDTDAVFLTIGGNDANFVGIVLHCFVMRNANTCKTRLDAGRNVATTTGPALLQKVLQAIDERSHGHAHVYLLNYPDLLNTDFYTLPEGPAGWYNVGNELRSLQKEYDGVETAALEAMNASTDSQRFHFVDVKKAFLGHGLNPYIFADQSNSWIVPPLSNFSMSSYMHPNQTGWNVEAGVLTQHVQQDFDTGKAPSLDLDDAILIGR